VHDAVNLAGVWRLPLIFLCQNNQIGEYTPISGYTASKDFASRAAGYGFKRVKLDANDVAGIYNGMKDIIAEIRQGEGPIFVQAVTQRLGNHAGPGDNRILSPEVLKHLPSY
jgi:2-oxoisovalerate dehydrogenase E1 component